MTQQLLKFCRCDSRQTKGIRVLIGINPIYQVLVELFQQAVQVDFFYILICRELILRD